MKLWVDASVIFFVLASGICVSSCTSKPSGPALGPDTLSLQLSGEPATLDPSLVEDGLGFRVLVNTMDGLMGFDNSGKLHPRLAQDVSLSQDRRTYTFKIRDGATWSDGVPITSDQIRFAIERALAPKTGSKLSSFLHEIEGARDFIDGKTQNVSGVKAEAGALTVKLVRPVSYFLEVFALPMTYPLRQDVLEKAGTWDPLRNKEVPTSGAYAFEDYQRDQHIVLKARRTLAEGAPARVILRIVQDESTGARLYDQSRLDILTRIPSYDQKKYESSGRVRVVPFLATYFLSFNLKKPPFDDVTFRRAVAGAIRRADLIKALGTGEMLATTWIPPGLEGHEKSRVNEEGKDPRFQKEVQRLRGRKFPTPVIIGFDTSGRNAMLMERIQADIQAALAWKVELKSSDWKTHLREIFADPPAIFRYGWSSPMQDPILFLSPFQTSDPFSFTTGYSNPNLDRLVDEIRGLSPGALRTRKIQEAQSILVEKDAVIVPLYHYVSTYVAGPRVERYEVNPYGHTRFEEVRLKR